MVVFFFLVSYGNHQQKGLKPGEKEKTKTKRLPGHLPRCADPCVGLVTNGRRWVCLELHGRHLSISKTLDISKEADSAREHRASESHQRPEQTGEPGVQLYAHKCPGPSICPKRTPMSMSICLAVSAGLLFWSPRLEKFRYLMFGRRQVSLAGDVFRGNTGSPKGGRQVQISYQLSRKVPEASGVVEEVTCLVLRAPVSVAWI